VQPIPVPNDGESVAAETASRRLDNRKDHRSRDGGIDRVSALQQHAKPGLRSQRL
jgi:hypothetical protein